MSDFVKMEKAEMARLMLEGKVLEFEGEIGYAVFDSTKLSPFRYRNGKIDDDLISLWFHPCRVKEAPTWEPKFRELVLVRDKNEQTWKPAEYGLKDHEGHHTFGGVWFAQVAPFSESLMGTTDPIPGQLGGE